MLEGWHVSVWVLGTVLSAYVWICCGCSLAGCTFRQLDQVSEGQILLLFLFVERYSMCLFDRYTWLDRIRIPDSIIVQRIT